MIWFNVHTNSGFGNAIVILGENDKVILNCSHSRDILNCSHNSVIVKNIIRMLVNLSLILKIIQLFVREKHLVKEMRDRAVLLNRSNLKNMSSLILG